MRLAGNKDSHEISDEFDFGPDHTTQLKSYLSLID